MTGEYLLSVKGMSRMKPLRLWVIGCGALTFGVVACAAALNLSGRPDLAHVAVNVALAVSVIGLLFAALMAVIIVWCEVHTGRALERSPRNAVVPSATSSPRVTFLPVAPSMSDRRKTPLVAVAGGKGVAGCSSKGVH